MAEQEAEVSVIIPAYNREALVGETIENLLRQSLAPHEVIVVDDGSTDGTTDLVRSFGDRVRLICQANAGPGAARNAGLAAATGNYIQFFDSDDLCTLDKLEKQVRTLQETGADLSYCGWIPVHVDDDKLYAEDIAMQQRPVGAPALDALLADWIFFLPSVILRREAIEKVGGYPTQSRTGEDIELMFRLCLADLEFAHTPGPLLLVRQHPEHQISKAAEHAGERARDRVGLNNRVEQMLADARYTPGLMSKLVWNAMCWQAQRDLSRFDHNASPPQKSIFQMAVVRLTQIWAGGRQRLTGSRLGRAYRVGPLTETQKRNIEELGYKLCIETSEGRRRI